MPDKYFLSLSGPASNDLDGRVLWQGRCAVAQYAFEEPASLPRWTMSEDTEVVVTEQRATYFHAASGRSGEIRWEWPQHLRVQPGNRATGRAATVTQIQLVCAGDEAAFPALVFAGGDLATVGDADRLANVLRQAIARYRVEHASRLGLLPQQARMLSRLVIGPEFSNYQGGEGQTVTLLGSVPASPPRPAAPAFSAGASYAPASAAAASSTTALSAPAFSVPAASAPAASAPAFSAPAASAPAFSAPEPAAPAPAYSASASLADSAPVSPSASPSASPSRSASADFAVAASQAFTTPTVEVSPVSGASAGYEPVYSPEADEAPAESYGHLNEPFLGEYFSNGHSAYSALAELSGDTRGEADPRYADYTPAGPVDERYASADAVYDYDSDRYVSDAETSEQPFYAADLPRQAYPPAPSHVEQGSWNPIPGEQEGTRVLSPGVQQSARDRQDGTQVLPPGVQQSAWDQQEGTQVLSPGVQQSAWDQQEGTQVLSPGMQQSAWDQQDGISAAPVSAGRSGTDRPGYEADEDRAWQARRADQDAQPDLASRAADLAARVASLVSASDDYDQPLATFETETTNLSAFLQAHAAQAPVPGFAPATPFAGFAGARSDSSGSADAEDDSDDNSYDRAEAIRRTAARFAGNSARARNATPVQRRADDEFDSPTRGAQRNG